MPLSIWSPSEAAGPEYVRMTPILTVCASAGSANAMPSAAPNARPAAFFAMLIFSYLPDARFGGRLREFLLHYSEVSPARAIIRLPNYPSNKRFFRDKRSSADLHHLLAEILALQEADEGARRVLDAVGHGLAVFDLAPAQILAEPLQRLGPAVHVVGDDEALQFDAHADRHHQRLHPMGIGRVILRDHAAERDARERIAARQHEIEDRPADILEIDVDAVGRRVGERALQIVAAVVDTGVETQLRHHVVAFLPAAGDADDAAARQLGELADDAADRARRRRDHDGVARLGLADIEKPDPGGDAGHADHAEMGRERLHARIDLAQIAAVGDRVLLPAGMGGDGVAHRKSRILRLDDFAHPLAGHDLADLRLGGVGARVVHAAAHIGVERQETVAHQHLAVLGRRHRRLDDAEIALLDPAGRPAGEQDLRVLVGHGGTPWALCVRPSVARSGHARRCRYAGVLRAVKSPLAAQSR